MARETTRHRPLVEGCSTVDVEATPSVRAFLAGRAPSMWGEAVVGGGFTAGLLLCGVYLVAQWIWLAPEGRGPFDDPGQTVLGLFFLAIWFGFLGHRLIHGSLVLRAFRRDLRASVYARTTGAVSLRQDEADADGDGRCYLDLGRFCWELDRDAFRALTARLAPGWPVTVSHTKHGGALLEVRDAVDGMVLYGFLDHSGPGRSSSYSA